MSNKVIVTIGREFGSGGHEVGKRLATELGIKFYDMNHQHGSSEDWIP